MRRPEVYVHRSRMPASAQQVFNYHKRPGALERLAPPWEQVRVVHRDGGIENGSRTVLDVALGPLHKRWVAEHRGYEEGHQFQDVQVEGPFAHWVHTHSVEPADGDGSWLEDRIEYRLPGGALAHAAAGAVTDGRLERMFRYRHAVMAHDLRRQGKDTKTMTVLITGASGLIGSALASFLTTGGHTVRSLTRSAARGEDEYPWDPAKDELDESALDGVDAVVHLAGESISERWTAEQKRRILDSRVAGTRLVANAIARRDDRPAVLVSASAVGYYGDRGEEDLTELDAPGDLFLSEVCQQWEAACQPARDAGVRVVNARLGIVLSAEGGALAKMLPPFKLGAGGPLGSGEQFWSWITRDDVVGAIHHCLITDDLDGPVNVTAPHPVTQARFARTLGHVLGRPAFMPAPKFALRLALGDMADEMLLASEKVIPTKLQASGFDWGWPELEGALRHVLGK